MFIIRKIMPIPFFFAPLADKTKRLPANSTSESQTLPQDTSTASSLQLKVCNVLAL